MFDTLTGWVMWLYILISSVVLVNLLVAMFSDTYARIKESSELEYTYLRRAEPRLRKVTVATWL